MHTNAAAANGDAAHAAGEADVPEAVPATEPTGADGVRPSDVADGEDTAAVSPIDRKPAVKRARKATATSTPGPASPSPAEPAVQTGTDAVLDGRESAAGLADPKPAVKRARKAKASVKAESAAQEAGAGVPGEGAVLPKVKRNKKTRAPPAAVPDSEQAELQVGADAAADDEADDEEPASAKKPKAKRRKKAQAADATADDGADVEEEDDADDAAAAKKPRKKRAPKVTWPPGVTCAYINFCPDIVLY